MTDQQHQQRDQWKQPKNNSTTLFWLFSSYFCCFYLISVHSSPDFFLLWIYQRHNHSRSTTVSPHKLTGDWSLIYSQRRRVSSLFLVDFALFLSPLLAFVTSSTNQSINTQWQHEKGTAAARVPLKATWRASPTCLWSKDPADSLKVG